MISTNNFFTDLFETIALAFRRPLAKLKLYQFLLVKPSQESPHMIALYVISILEP